MASTARRRRQSWGAIRKLPSGRFQARYADPEHPGKYVTADRTFATRTDADAELSRIRTKLEDGSLRTHKVARATTVAEYAEVYLSRRPKLSPKTLESYRRGLALYVEPKLGPLPLVKVTSSVVADWWAELMRELPDSGRGMTNRVRAYETLRAVFAEAVEHDILAASPCRLRVAVKPAPRPHVTVEQVGALVEGMPERWRAGVLLAATTGLRFGELAGLRVRHVDLLHRRLTVAVQLITLADNSLIEQAPKTDAGRRTLSLPPHLIPILQAHLEEYVGDGSPDAYLFTDEKGRPLRHRPWNKEWIAARTAAGLPDVHFHDLRHAALTLLAQSGATLAELMHHAGHAAPAAAIRYQRVAEGRADVLAERMSAAWELSNTPKVNAG